MRSSYSQREAAVMQIRIQVLTIVGPVLYTTELSRYPNQAI